MSKYICDFSVASCIEDGGVYKYHLFDDGRVEEYSRLALPCPMFLEVNADKLTVLMMSPFEGSRESGIAVYDKTTDKLLTPAFSTLGVEGCHIAACGDDIYCANYTTGSVFKAPDILRVHSGSGVDKSRQEAPHTHSTFFTPDKKYLIVCDLGTDEIYVYDRSLNEVSRVRVPDGNGPRHVCFSKDSKYMYCLTEMGANLCVFSYNDGKLSFIKEISTKPQGFTAIGAGAAIKITADGKRIYTSERASETIALFDVDGENVTLRAHFDTHGAHPRDFSLVANDSFLICANRFSNNLSIYRVLSDGALEFLNNASIKEPLCVCEL